MIDKKKTLVAYFTLTGRTETVANKIAAVTNGTLFKIEPKKAYSKAYNTAVDLAKVEKFNNTRPEIKNEVSDFDSYDQIAIGFPVWWYTCPMIILTFLEQYNFEGKTVYPFCTHGGGGSAQSSEDMAEVCTGATVKECLDANRLTKEEITNWVKAGKKLADPVD